MLPLLTNRLPAFLDQSAQRMTDWLRTHGESAMRFRQIRHWLFVGRATNFAEMTDLPKKLRVQLADEFRLFQSEIASRQQSCDGTQKLLLRLFDGHHIECVMIPEKTRRTACISTQVGCGMGCVFCASGLNGVVRNLSQGEILEQLLHLRNLLPRQERLTNIVVMGMGEPLANLDALADALDIACSRDGLGIGARHVTISTVGLPAKMRRLAELGKPYHLAVSLHAPNDALRARIVPTNSATGIRAILEAADLIFSKTGRRVTYEYVLLGGINDSKREARELARLLAGRCAHVNLIPFNEVAGLPYRPPTQRSQTDFVAELRRAGINVKVRKRKGADIDAACGQLRRKIIEKTGGVHPDNPVQLARRVILAFWESRLGT
ncbi:MAG: putative dual-specificity RNA methyltransferase RlmN [Gemmatales bacterium]|nr:MAG: putative dual-specificity RNA methyltransferase RlmN [Gemmatales bacterium]